MDMVVDDFRVVALRMPQHAVHEFRALQPLDVAWPVVYIGRRHELPALFDAGNDDGIQVRARGVDRRRVAGGPRAEDENTAMLQVTHV